MNVTGPPTDFILVLQDILDSGVAALDPTPSRAVISPGRMETWDDCCEGMAWIRLSGLSTAGGRPPTGVGPAFSDVTIEMGILRCEATVNDDGVPPSAEEISADSSQVFSDMLNLRKVLGGIPGMHLDSWEPVGPEGGCVGGKWLMHSRFVHTGWKESV